MPAPPDLSNDHMRLISGWRRACEAEGDSAEQYFEPLDELVLFERSLVSDIQSAEWLGGPTVGRHLLATGFRGSGKTTALRRVHRALEGDGYRVVFVDAGTLHALHGPITPIDFFALLFALVARHPLGANLWPALQDRAERSLPVRFLKGVGLRLAGEDASVQLAAPSPNALDLEAAKATTAALMHALVQAGMNEGKPTVLIVDSLEKFRASHSQLRDTMAALEAIFTGHANGLKFPGLHCIYTLPPVLAVHGPAPSEFGGACAIMPSVRVVTRDGGPNPDGVAALLRLLNRRMALAEAFTSTEAAEELAAASGGHVRDLLQLAGWLAKRAAELGQAPPWDEAFVGARVNEFSERFRPLEARAVELAMEIDHARVIRMLRADDYPVLDGLLDSHALLSYRNGTSWFAMHPLTKRVLEQDARRG